MEAKTYYIGIRLSDNKVIISTSKVVIANHLSISSITIYRQLKNKALHINSEYIIAKTNKINTIKRGFALK